MAYKIRINYTGPAKPENIRFVSPICPIYCPCNSYADTQAYEGTCYDTNVRGFGKIDVMEPYASTAFPFPVPLAQFKIAVIGADGTNSKGEDCKYVEFEVATYMEAFFYIQAGIALADQGFEVIADPDAAGQAATEGETTEGETTEG